MVDINNISFSNKKIKKFKLVCKTYKSTNDPLLQVMLKIDVPYKYV